MSMDWWQMSVFVFVNNVRLGIHVNIKFCSFSDQVLLRALRDFRSTSLQQTIQHSGVNSPAEEFQRKARKVPGTQWWRSRFPLTPQAMKRHQDISSYNLNSFGLRYGKWCSACSTSVFTLCYVFADMFIYTQNCKKKKNYLFKNIDNGKYHQ